MNSTKNKNLSIQIRRIIHSMFLFAITFNLISCGSNQMNEQHDSKDSVTINKVTTIEQSVPDSIVLFLINAAANDFSAHQPPTVLEFRNLKIGYILSDTNMKTFLLCGEFLSVENKQKNQWEAFATLKTEGYKQWLGAGSMAYCQQAHFVVENDSGLAKRLLAKMTPVKS